MIQSLQVGGTLLKRLASQVSAVAIGKDSCQGCFGIFSCCHINIIYGVGYGRSCSRRLLEKCRH
jgi:hypothetical protein